MSKIHVCLKESQPPIALSPTIIAPASASKEEEKQPPHSTDAGVHYVNLDTIPPSLKARPNWVQWKIGHDGKSKPTKLPYVAGSHQKAAATNPQTWGSFDAAVASLKDDRGLGFVLPLSGEIFFVDLDHVRINKLVRSHLGRCAL